MDNSGSGPGDADKKDLTGLHDLPPADPVEPEGGSDFSVNEAASIEQVEQFESIDQIGMMDHPASSAEEFPPAVFQEPPPFLEDPLQVLPEQGTAVPESAPEDFLIHQSVQDTMQEPPTAEAPVPLLDDLRIYSESQKSAPFDPGIRLEFHLQISGDFDPYSRDKLLLFITDHPIGMTSSELDFQLQAGRVLLPRISEFSGIKLIQELRDSGLDFSLAPASSEDFAEHEPRRAQFGESGGAQPQIEIPIFPEGAYSPADYVVLDSLQLVHYLRAEILEVEKSELFQELLERMTSSLKKRAQLKGAHALTRLEHRITPLRLPSQYQLELSASLLKKTES